MDLGDRALGSTISFTFTTVDADQAGVLFDGSPVLRIYHGSSATQTTAGVTLTANFDLVTGLNHVSIVASTANGFASGEDCSVVVQAGTADGVSLVGYTVATFSIENRQTKADVRKVNDVTVAGDGSAGNPWGPA